MAGSNWYTEYYGGKASSSSSSSSSKSTTSSSSSSSKKPAGVKKASPQPSDPNSYSDYDPEAEARARINGELDALKTATNNSKNTFSTDVSSYNSNLLLLEESPCTTAFYDHMKNSSLNISSITSSFEDMIKIINSSYR